MKRLAPAWVDLRVRGDNRGRLLPVELERDLPFRTRRVYFIFDVVPGALRGQHAHHVCRQAVLPIAGSCTLVLDDGRSQVDVHLSRSEQALLVEPGIWHEMHSFSAGCVLAVFADQPFDAGDYIRDYDEFLALVSEGRFG
jgi:dTDP-4-dehydrorhamnose 3,5-epimerase-like enzyme